MNIIALPSPNCDSREGQPVDMLVLHYTGMASATHALERLCDPVAKVSAHYVVDEDGTVYRLVAEDQRAWHAGVSYWRGHTNINQRSIGVEIVNPGHEFGYRPFPKLQMEAVAGLCKAIMLRHAIPMRNVVGHSDVAPNRKEDPGELFDWKWLAGQGVGLFPTILPDSPQATPDELSAVGYDSGQLDKAIVAFQRRYRPQLLACIWDKECAQLLFELREIGNIHRKQLDTINAGRKYSLWIRHARFYTSIIFFILFIIALIKDLKLPF